MNEKSDDAVAMMVAGFNCAQSVLGVFCEELKFDRETAMRLATGFGAGLARKQEVCGAVTGSVMAIGLKYGRGADDGKPEAEHTYLLVGKLMERFTARRGSCLCRVLLDGCDLQSESGRKFFNENKLAEKICRPCVADAVRILETIL